MTGFDTFWQVWPRKVCKRDARHAFERINGDVELDTILVAVAEQAQAGVLRNSKWTPHPATWLNGERWEDELPQDEEPSYVEEVSGIATSEWWIAKRNREARQ